MNFLVAEFAIAIPAGVLVAISLLFKQQRKLRLFNMLGSILFTAYGICLIILSRMETGWATVALNITGVLASAIWLIKNRGGR